MPNYVLSERDIKRIQDAVRYVEANRSKIMRDAHRRRGRGGGGGDSRTRRAKAQEDGQANGLLSVKLLDSDGNETGEAFDVFAFADQSATDMADYLPVISSADLIFIKQDLYGNWYIDWTPLEIGTATDTVSATAGTVGGRLINNWVTKF